MRLLMVQYAGDYREAVQRFAEGGGETYYAQKYSVDAVAEIGQKIEEVAVLCCMTKEPYNEVLKNGVRAIGAGFNQEIEINKLIKLIEEQKPTHLVVRTTIREVFRWAIQKKIRTIATFAESVSTRGLRSKLRNQFLANLLNNNRIEWVGSYGINSSLLFQQIGVKSDKIIPWDFIVTITPDSFSPKTLQGNGKTWKLFYIGSMIESKGVGDILESIAKLRAENFPVSLKIAGRDETDFYINKARQLQIEDCVEFLGLVPNNTVVPLMREADLVLVPSRHEYPEGFPLAITHAFCSRTPLIASDHPMFQKNLKHGSNAMIFPAGNSIALAACIEKLLSEPELYQSLSVASYEAWERLQIPVKWADMINRWLDDSPENQQWLFERRLSSGRYNSTFT
jgi:glycosyltransferase involved in cell wall biosynthesis